MKKFIISALSVLSVAAFAQTTSIQLKDVNNSNAVIPANGNLYKFVGANHTISFDIDITNMGSTQNTYNVKRYDYVLNTNASAHFCFGGNCYTSATEVSPNPLTLNSGQSASQVAGSYNLLTVELDEAPTVGISKIKYTFFNTANVSDSVQITVNYNVTAPVGIKENTKTIGSLELFPNPAKGFTSIRINSPIAAESELMVYNSLGEVVYSKNLFLNEGKNKIDVNLENLPSGVYFASLKTGEASISKKLIINN